MGKRGWIQLALTQSQLMNASGGIRGTTPPSQTTVSTHQHSSSSLRSLLPSLQSSAIFTIADDEYFIIPDDCITTFKVAPPRALTVVPRIVAHSLSCVGEVKTALR
ncbi:hypothetical protein JHK85_015253 [Glycine max]|nr:hypothetical protein JHK85_015253 [Glycine max]